MTAVRHAWLLLILAAFLSSCNAMCLASTDPDIWGQSGDDFTHPAWYAESACTMADVLP